VQLALVQLVADLRLGLLVDLRLADVLLGRLVGGRRHLVRVVGVDARLDPLLLGEPGQLVIVQALRRAAVLAPVAVELLRRLRVLLAHEASR